jgi:hypothetical protein
MKIPAGSNLTEHQVKDEMVAASLITIGIGLGDFIQRVWRKRSETEE